jgi:hypothetical protein
MAWWLSSPARNRPFTVAAPKRSVDALQLQQRGA